ncbi:MAG: 2-dehydro-3-deoxygalactonokinase [Clostridia bacterium]|nr:2-dehydro-3-deoxygalactonokinase [Clostridia bacterium]
MIITVDCGTTNMRCRLFDEKKLIDQERALCGCRDRAFTGSSAILEENLSALIKTLLERNSLTESDIEVIISSGTLASDVGIHKIPHAVCPAGIPESVNAAELVVKENVSPIPILFIPGVKTLPPDDADIETKILTYESMSGEESEIYGITEALGLPEEFIITLPGSHNKVMEVKDGKICSIRSGMCGEFIASISGHTMLKSALPQPVIREIIPEMLLLGYRMADKYGLSPMLIKARMLQLLGGYTQNEAANFFVGALLHDDIASVASIAAKPESLGKPLVVGGSDPLKTIFMILLKEAGAENLVAVPPEVATLASNYGAMRVYEAWKKANER